MHREIRLSLGLSLAIAALGCGTDSHPDADATEEGALPAEVGEADRALVCQPADLVAPTFVQVVARPSGMLGVLPAGGVLRLPCRTNEVDVRFTYTNRGFTVAPPHHNRIRVDGLSSVVHAHPGVAAGGVGFEMFASYPLPLVAGDSRTLLIGVDNLDEVLECREDDNVFAGKLVSACP